MSLLAKFQLLTSSFAGKLPRRCSLALFSAVVLTNCSVPRVDMDSTPGSISPQEIAFFQCEMTYRGGGSTMCPGAKLTRMSDKAVVAQSTRVGGILEGRRDIRMVKLVPGYYSLEIETCPPIELWYSVYTPYCFYAKPGLHYIVRQEFPKDWSKGCWKLWIEERETGKVVRPSYSGLCTRVMADARFHELEQQAKLSQKQLRALEHVQIEAANAKFENASRVKDAAESWRLICSAAHEGSEKARFALGIRYRWGRPPVSRDLVRAHVWFALGTNSGHVPSARAQAWLEQEMTSEQLTEAKQLEAGWKPDPAKCDLEATKSED